MRAEQSCPSRARRVAPYDEVAPLYDRWKWQEFWRRNETPVVRDLLGREPIVARAMDIGAGTGLLAALLAERVTAVTAVDASIPMLRELVKSRPTTAAVQADAERLPFRDAVFDRLGASRVLSHFDTAQGIFEECARVARRAAAFIVTDLHPDFEYDQTTFGLGNAACSAPFSPTRHALANIDRDATATGFDVEQLLTFTADRLLWRPPPGAFVTLDANDGAVFYVALLRRR